jgi:malonyl-CoA/methylmalonyl-CoA synthetase
LMKRDVARFKHPRDYIIVDELPRNTMGKVQKNIMRDTYADWFASGTGSQPLILK